MDTSFHYTTVVLRVWGWQSQKCNSKCPNDINTEWAIPENFSSFSMFLFVFYFFTFVFYFTFKCSCFLLYAWKFHILNPSLLPLFVFFHYSVCTVISDCNHPFDTSTFTHTVSQEYIYCNWKYISEWSFFEINKYIT